MSQTSSTTDWTKCTICQNHTKEKLRSSAQGHETLARLLPEFSKLNVLDFDLARLETPGLTLQESLNRNNAVYHHSCSSKHNQQKLDRALERFNRIQSQQNDSDIHSPPCKRRSENLHKDTNHQVICCFCQNPDNEINLHAAGTYHASQSKTNVSHVESLTTRWKSMAVILGDDNLIRALSTGDVAANEIYYHTQCLRNFHNRFNKVQKQAQPNINEENESNWIKVSALNKVFYYMCDIEQQEPSKVFKVKELENMYIELLKCQGIEIQSHVSRFAELLLERNIELEKRTVGKNVVVYFRRTADAFFKDAISEPSSFLRSVQEVVIPLRKIMSSSQNNFDGSFLEDCQAMSIPIELLTLVSLLIDGLNIDNDNFSQPSLTVSQLILSNFKHNNRNATNQDYRRSNRKLETPIQIYTSLKLYSTIRSRNLIDHMFKLGICSSYDRVLELTKSLSDNMTNQYHHDGIFAHQNSRNLSLQYWLRTIVI